MKFYFKLVLVLFFSIQFKSFSQKVEAGIYYPLILGSSIENTFNASYNGVVGLDARYRVKDFKLIKVKLGTTIDYLSLDTNNIGFKGSNFRLNPNVIIALNLKKLEPYCGIGYTFWFTKGTSADDFESQIQEQGNSFFEDVEMNENGGNLFYKLGVRYKFYKLFYIDVNAYLADIFKKEDLDVSSQDKIILNTGIGVIF